MKLAKPEYATIQQIRSATLSMLRPPKRMTVSEAAEEYRYLNNPGSYVGSWNNRKAPYLVEPMDTVTSLDFEGMIFVGPARTGKALALDTPIPTPSGWTTMGDLREGDLVFGSSGRATTVTFKSQVFHNHDCYRLTFSDGSHIVADAGHKWSVIDSANQNKTRVLTTEYMATRVQYRTESRNRFLVESASALAFSSGAVLPLHPYILGLWLGDGHNIGARLATSAEDVDELMLRINECNFPCRYSVDSFGKYTVYLSAKRFNPGRLGGADHVSSALQSMGMLRGRRKFIPEPYFTASIEERLALLQGLMDTDGSADKRGRVEFCNTEYALAMGVRRLLWSLGIKNTMSVRKTIGQDAYRVWFTPGDKMRIFRFSRKQARLHAMTDRASATVGRRSIVRIEKVNTVPTQCITVSSPDHLFVAGDGCILTHNSDMFLNWVGHTAKTDPADMMLVHMTQNTARDYSLGDFAKMLRHSTKIGGEVAPGKHNVHDIRFKSGMRVLIKWPSITELSGKTVPRLWAMDYDRMEQDVDGEGNPFDLMKKRAESFKRFGMAVAESSPGFEVTNPKWIAKSPHEAPPTKGVLELYNRGDRRRWNWQCIDCSEAFEPDFNLLNYPPEIDPDTGEILEAIERAERVTLDCPHCHFKHTPDMKQRLNEAGRWIKEGQRLNADGTITGKGRRSNIASFWMKGPAAVFQDWSSLVLNYLQAMEAYDSTGDTGPLKKTVNTDQGLPFTPPSLEAGLLPEVLKDRAEDWGGTKNEPVVPEGARFLIATVDVQAGARAAFVVQVHGMHDNGDISLIDMFKIRKSDRIDEDDARKEHALIDPAGYPEDWQLLVPQVIEKTYPLADGSGRRMQIKMTACDMGGADGVTTNAYNFWRWLRDDEECAAKGHRNRFHLVKGEPSKSAPRFRIGYPDAGRKDRHSGARGDVPVAFFNGTLLKDRAYGMLTRKEEGGRVRFPKWAENWLYMQLTAEVRTADRWENPSKKRNESWDLLYYALGISLHATIRLEHIDWDRPPSWAEAWDKNSLVFGEEVGEAFVVKKAAPVDLSKLASEFA